MCRIDTAFCSRKVLDPKPNNKFGGLEFKNPAATPHATMNIKSWIEGIGKSSGSTDMLSTFDKSIKGSIGGLGSKMESMWVQRARYLCLNSGVLIQSRQNSSNRGQTRLTPLFKISTRSTRMRLN